MVHTLLSPLSSLLSPLSSLLTYLGAERLEVGAAVADGALRQLVHQGGGRRARGRPGRCVDGEDVAPRLARRQREDQLAVEAAVTA
jgi:hypothetical protein